MTNDSRRPYLHWCESAHVLVSMFRWHIPRSLKMSMPFASIWSRLAHKTIASKLIFSRIARNSVKCLLSHSTFEWIISLCFWNVMDWDMLLKIYLCRMNECIINEIVIISPFKWTFAMNFLIWWKKHEFMAPKKKLYSVHLDDQKRISLVIHHSQEILVQKWCVALCHFIGDIATRAQTFLLILISINISIQKDWRQQQRHC